jgi:hypothetical protein
LNIVKVLIIVTYILVLSYYIHVFIKRREPTNGVPWYRHYVIHPWIADAEERCFFTDRMIGGKHQQAVSQPGHPSLIAFCERL